MATFLTDEWVAELDEAAQASDALRTATAEVTLTIQQVIRGTDGGDGTGEIAWHITVDRGDVRVRPGRAPRPDVVFTQDRPTAVAVARGELSAQAAFMLGRLRLGGDVARLMEHQGAFADLDDVFAELRARTDY